MLTRRTLALAAAAALLALPALAQQRFDGVTLRVATYGGGFDKAVQEGAGAQFEALGGRLEFVLGSPPNHITKLIAARNGPPPFDVFDVADSNLQDAIEGGFVETIDLAKISNLRELLPSQYTNVAIAGWSSQDGIMYNPEKFKELGLPAPVRYTDLLDPKLKDRVMSIDLTTPGSVHMIVAAAKDAGGDEAHLDAGFDYLRKLRALKYYKVGSEGLLNLKLGEVYAVTTSAGFALQGEKDKVPVAFVHTQIGKQKGFNKYNYVSIAKGTPNKAAAEAFIDMYLSQAAQFILAQRRGVIPANAAARDQLAQDPAMAKYFILAKDDFANMMSVDWSKIDSDAFAARWNRAIAR